MSRESRTEGSEAPGDACFGLGEGVRERKRDSKGENVGRRKEASPASRQPKSFRSLFVMSSRRRWNCSL